jgi:hypothetical protein
MPIPKWNKRAAVGRQGDRVKQKFFVAVSVQARELSDLAAKTNHGW